MKKNTKRTIIIAMVFVVFIEAFVLYFNRTPDRIVPEGNLVVSPANGTVIHIESTNDSEIEFYKKEILQTLEISGMTPPFSFIVIEMDPSNVHAQRAPIMGEIIAQEYSEGEHANALWSKDVEKLANINEKVLTVFDNGDDQIGVIQVAGAAARRIRNSRGVGDKLQTGEIYGRILLGSQVVTVIEVGSYDIVVEVGDMVVDGETVLAD